ncbi:MAG: GNAT family N-acetyltransferase [Pirellulaceae bacterium]|nr:GNAT family N-acetyltransferase [Pirellulaceae bacterium]
MPSEHHPLAQPVGQPVSNWQPPQVPSQEALEGRFCRVEALSAERHAGELHAANSLDAENRNWTYMTYGPFANFEEYSAWVSASAASSDPLFFAIIDKSSEKAVGVASYLRIDPRHGSIEVGHLQFSPLLQGKPAATEAMFLMMQRAFELGYRRYEWKCNALNEPSRRAAQRLGLSFEGIFRQAAVVKGRNRDTAWYAAIDQEWLALKAAFEQWLAPSNFDESGRQRMALSALTAPLLKQQ